MNSFKHALRGPDMVLGAWLELGSCNVAEVMVANGWDILIIDGEHGPGGLEDWVTLSRTVTAAGGTPILRLPDADETMIKRALDRGFKNFVVPMINTAEHAKQVVSAFYYPPRGHRGYAAPVVRGSGWGSDTVYATHTSYHDLTIMLQCEHIEAVENIDAICAVDGIDAIFIGPNDLAASAGYLERLDAPEVLSLLARIEAAAKTANMPLATVRSAGRDWADLRALGYNFVAGAGDIGMLAQMAALERANAQK
jgi:2-keto-3-deoxy-L-rhamnonate aldolase RhmA